MPSFVQRYLELIEPGKRRRWIGVVVFAIAVSGLEALGAVLVYTLISLTTDPQSSIDLPLVGDLRRWLPDLSPDRLTVAMAAGVAVFFVLRAAIVLLQRYHQGRTTQEAGVELSVRLLQRYLQLPYSFHLGRNSAELIRNAKDSVGEILGSIISPSVRIISSALVVIGILAVLIVTAPLATALAVLVMSPFVLLTLKVVQPRLKRLGRVRQQASAMSYQALQQGLNGYRDITVLGRQDFFLERFREARTAIAEARYKQAVLSQFPRVSIEATVIVFIAGFISVSTLAGDGGQRSIPILGLFAYAALRIMPAVNDIVSSLNAMRFGGAALEDVRADLALPVPASHHGLAELPFQKTLQLEDVTFSYEGTDEPTLRDISLTIPQGASIGVVGATGAGKSTLIDLIVGLSTPTQGTILVDGQDLRGQEAAWQRNIGMVSQEVFLLDDTLRCNIALGVAQDEIDDQRVIAAVRLAQLEGFVDSLPGGLDTRVGERGVRVSGGQRQRVAIARALYPGPSLLVFDEGTAALDNLTEAALIEALSQLRDDHTIITVAHRLSTVQDFDLIVFMQGGRVRDVGSFTEVASRDEDFRSLARWSESTV